VDWQDRIIEKWQEKARRQVELAKEDVVKTLTTMWKGGQGSEGTLYSSPKVEWDMYSQSHGRRRSNNGKQTSKVDLSYSGTLIKSLKETARVDTTARVAVTISFTGNANRRSDQKDSITNSQLAGYLGIQFNQDILRLKKDDKDRIEKKYGVRITYD
jgi:hypothetical protein